MNTMIKSAVLSTAFVLMLIGDIQLTSTTLHVGWISEAHAILGTWRRAARTAVMVDTIEKSQHPAAAAPTPALAPAPAYSAPAPYSEPPPVPAGKVLPLGTVVSQLPSGCTPEPVNGVEYYRCGANSYRAVFQGGNLVYVTAQP